MPSFCLTNIEAFPRQLYHYFSSIAKKNICIIKCLCCVLWKFVGYPWLKFVFAEQMFTVNILWRNKNLASTRCRGNHDIFPTICFQGCLWRNKDGHRGRSPWCKKNYSTPGGFRCFGSENRCRGVLTDKHCLVPSPWAMLWFCSFMLTSAKGDLSLCIFSPASWCVKLVLCCWKRWFNHRLCCPVPISWG